MVKIAIMQPTYFPWMGYFDLIDRVEKFVFLDDVKVSKQSWGVRNRIKTKQGEIFITVPLKNYTDHLNRFFSNTAIDYNQKWNVKHLKSISQAYSKDFFFNEVFKDIENILNVQFLTIADLNIFIIQSISKKFNIQSEFYRSSNLPPTKGSKDYRLVEICQALNADCYLSPQGSANYIEAERVGGAFSDSRIKLYYHNFDHPEYPQQKPPPFMSHMSIIDSLMNCGYEETIKIIASGRREMISTEHFRQQF